MVYIKRFTVFQHSTTTVKLIRDAQSDKQGGLSSQAARRDSSIHSSRVLGLENHCVCHPCETEAVYLFLRSSKQGHILMSC